MNPKVSIIVPIYNMERYLDRCLRSLLAQTLEDIEIVAVDDGSKDSSLRVLERYARKDPRVKIISKSNAGVSAARNDGVRAASGHYIGFVDPDDWVAADMYAEMYDAALTDNVDIVMCGYIREFGTHSKEKAFPLPHKQTYRMDKVKSGMLRRLIGPLGNETGNPEYLDAWGTVWSKLYRSGLIRGHSLTFTDLSVIGSNEDTLFNLHAFYCAESFQFLNRSYYHYWRANEASITSSYNDALPDRFEKLYGFMEAFIDDKQLAGEYKTALNNRISMNVIGLGLNVMNGGKALPAARKLKEIGALLRRDRIRHSLKRLDAAGSPLIWRVFFLCAKYRLAPAVYLMLAAMDWMRIRKAGRTRIGTGSDLAGGHHHESRRARNHADELLPSNGQKQNTV